MAIKAKKVKMTRRERCKYRVRKKIYGTDDCPRVTITRSNNHTYAQAISDSNGKTLVSACTLDKDVQGKMGAVDKEGAPNDSTSRKSIVAAKAVGVVLGEKCKGLNIEKAVFDRNGFQFHGRVKAVADGLRDAGMTL